jgi:hypothetical protein
VLSKPFTINGLSFNGYALSLSSQQLLAVVMILFLTFINTRGLQTGKIIQNTFTFTKTAALLGLIVIGLLFRLESRQRCLHVFVVAAVGKRLEAFGVAGVV